MTTPTTLTPPHPRTFAYQFKPTTRSTIHWKQFQQHSSKIYAYSKSMSASTRFFLYKSPNNRYIERLPASLIVAGDYQGRFCEEHVPRLPDAVIRSYLRQYLNSVHGNRGDMFEYPTLLWNIVYKFGTLEQAIKRIAKRNRKIKAIALTHSYNLLNAT